VTPPIYKAKRAKRPARPAPAIPTLLALAAPVEVEDEALPLAVEDPVGLAPVPEAAEPVALAALLATWETETKAPAVWLLGK